ncbi:MAG: hypothetical protein ACRDPK_10220 [Carbonactinosporaceae bacterium]
MRFRLPGIGRARETFPAAPASGGRPAGALTPVDEVSVNGVADTLRI